MSKKQSTDNFYGTAKDGRKLPKSRIPHYNHMLDIKAIKPFDASNEVEAPATPTTDETNLKKEFLEALNVPALKDKAAELNKTDAIKGLNKADIILVLLEDVEIQDGKADFKEVEAPAAPATEETTTEESKSEEVTEGEAVTTDPKPEELSDESKHLVYTTKVQEELTKLEDKFKEDNGLDKDAIMDEAQFREYAQSNGIGDFDTKSVEELREAIKFLVKAKLAEQGIVDTPLTDATPAE